MANSPVPGYQSFATQKPMRVQPGRVEFSGETQFDSTAEFKGSYDPKQVLTYSTAADVPVGELGRVGVVLYLGTTGGGELVNNNATPTYASADLIPVGSFGYVGDPPVLYHNPDGTPVEITKGIDVRDPDTVYADGVIIQDATGIYRGDDATAGGVLYASPSFNVAATETFTRSGVAYDYITGEVAADGEQSLRTLRYPDKNSALYQFSDTAKISKGVTSAGTWLATDLATGTAHIYRSTDKGLTWTTVMTGSTATGATVKNITTLPIPGGELLLAVCVESTGITLRLSTDDGETWTSNTLSATEQAALVYATSEFSRTFLVPAVTGVALADRKILFTPYGAQLSYGASATSHIYGSNRVFQSTLTLGEIAAKTSWAAGDFGWKKLFQVNMPQYYAATPGFGRLPTNVLIASGTTDSASDATHLNSTGAFASLDLTKKPHVEILTSTVGAEGQVRYITSKTNDALTITNAWAVNPASGDTFRVVGLCASGKGIHIHSADYYPATDTLYLSFGDDPAASSGSNGVIAIAGYSTLVPVTIGSVAPEEAVNWASASYEVANIQPTRIDVVDGTLIFSATDSSTGWIGKSVGGVVETTIWDFTNPASKRNVQYPYDGVRLDNGQIVSTINNSDTTGYGGILVGDPSLVDGMSRILRVAGGGLGWANGIGNRIAMHPRQMLELAGLDEFDGVFLGRAQTNRLTNFDLSAYAGVADAHLPTGWTWSGTNTKRNVLSSPTPFGGLNFWRWLATSSAVWEANMYILSLTEGDVIEFACWVRTNGRSYPFAAVQFFNGGTGVGSVTNGNAVNASVTGWQRTAVKATAPAGIDRVKCYVKYSGSAATGAQADICAPTGIKTPCSPIVPGTRSAESLRYTVASATAVKPNAKLVFKFRPLAGSTDDAVRADDIVSVESVNGYRAKLQYTDDGSGTKAFKLLTYDSAGSVIATTPIGYIPHGILDVFHVEMLYTSGSLGVRIMTPSESIYGAQSWGRQWMPKTIAFGEDYWASGTETANRFSGWYAFSATSGVQLA